MCPQMRDPNRHAICAATGSVKMKKTILFGMGIFIFLFFIHSYSAETFRFVVMSDSHNTLGSVNPEEAATAIRKMNPRLILHTGDFTCCSGQPHNRFKFDEYQFLGGIPVFPTTGNHDFDGKAQTAYNAFWNSRKPAVPINGVWAHTYSFDYEGFHFIAIDWRDPNFSWVKNDLKNNANKPTVVFSHFAALNIGCKPDFNIKLSSLAETNPDIKAVFSGNSHCITEKAIKPGTLQVFTGTISHDNRRGPRFKRKHTFVVVDVDGRNLKICPASVEDGILEGGCN